MDTLSTATPLSPADTALLETVWKNLRQSTLRMIANDPLLAPLGEIIVLESMGMASGLSKVLTRHLLDSLIEEEKLTELFLDIYLKTPEIVAAGAADLMAVVDRDPATTDILYPFLHYKGFHALQTHRIAHWLWTHDRKDAALFLQSRSSVLFSVDIHPAAHLGRGIMLDHAHSIVIGETAVVEDDVSMLHEVTLGGTGKERGDRHPKIRRGVMIGAGAKILGNVDIGAGASIAAGSVVLENVPPHTTVAGVPAKVVGKPKSETPATEMDQSIPL